MCVVHIYNDTIIFFFVNLVKSNFCLSKIELKINSKMKICDLCHKPDKIHYRVKSIIHRDWIFCCKECWIVISKHNDNSYGGTRKSK